MARLRPDVAALMALPPPTTEEYLAIFRLRRRGVPIEEAYRRVLPPPTAAERREWRRIRQLTVAVCAAGSAAWRRRHR